MSLLAILRDLGVLHAICLSLYLLNSLPAAHWLNTKQHLGSALCRERNYVLPSISTEFEYTNRPRTMGIYATQTTRGLYWKGKDAAMVARIILTPV